ncbi:DUF3800 domain-containing protein [Evansella cellulosilytica]|uniref:DUF3800 domain-containing protein n=1 Tax=Evansella cellulosilytica (strain ATCC 21833 / DSM 2522 / FERM P-1141 / JCM 9156 / N-4) TaxID=649639 RepID=E6TVF6_EVAC2|nr:DUF3800 domain-containing protein [Evansella cellulosilytica]ADU30973.1 hypothetical protein Bcell_2718 [Evansella cellulosilytica DSM 2522]
MLNIYCDESCHLENDGEKVMILGSISCPKRLTRSTAQDIFQIKFQHGINKYAEIKWTKVSNSNLDYFISLVDYFFKTAHLSFRALIAEKNGLRHDDYQQTHDDWYYKMYYLLLRGIIDPEVINNVYLDIKDTNGTEKVINLRKYLSHYLHDFEYRTIEKIQLIRSEESQLLQLADLLIGAIGYENRDIDTSDAKLRLVQHIKNYSGTNLRNSTRLNQRKFNLFLWEPDRW